LAAKQAGKILLNYYGKKEMVREKPNKTFVAQADLESNRIIIKTIKKYFPEHSILSEETGFEGDKSDYKWIIDPLDGTHNFLHDIPLFGTSIALQRKNEVILGVMHFPALKLTAVAEKGKGAFLNGKKMKVSIKKDLKHAFLLFEYALKNRKEKAKYLKKFVYDPIDFRNFGSAIYDLMLVACGKSDGFIILWTYPWDVAAGFIVVEEAGGKVTNLKGKKWNLKENKFVISNGGMHSKLLAYFR
jgi:myo-inositol-1(or 4)-monophosphatase